MDTLKILIRLNCKNSHGPFAAGAFNQSDDKHGDPIIWKSDAEFTLQLE